MATGDSSHAAWLQQARSHLRDADPVLGRIIEDRPTFDPQESWRTRLPPMDLFAEKWRPYRSLATSYLFSAALESAGAPPAVQHRRS